MKPISLTFLASLLTFAAGAQNDALYDISVAIDPLEIRMLPLTDDPQPDEQRLLREASGWNSWAADHANWRCIMSEATGLPHRAFGPAIDVPGLTIADKATAFAAGELDAFGVDAPLAWDIESKMGPVSYTHLTLPTKA